MLATAQVSTTAVPTKTCCDHVSEALGRCWQWIVRGWNWCIHKIFGVVDGVAFGFFRAVECVSPRLALRMEAGYGYLRSWYTRHQAEVAKQISDKTLAEVRVENQKLNAQVVQSTGDLGALRVTHAEIKEHAKRLASQSAKDIQAKEQMAGQHRLMQDQCLNMRERSRACQREVERVNQELQEVLAGRAPILKDKRELECELAKLKLEMQFAEARASLAEKERDLLFKTIVTFTTEPVNPKEGG